MNALMSSFKILSYNLGYCAGFTGSVPKYVLYSLRHIRCSPKVKAKVLSDVRRMLREEEPDLCCFMEIEPQSLAHLSESLSSVYAQSHIINKYGEESVFQTMPTFSKRSNGIMSKMELPFQTHFLKNGMKKLLYEIPVQQDLHVFAGHFALQKNTRQEQFTELKKLVAKRERVILCGDFNIFKGFGELDELIRHGDLQIINTEDDHTYPSHKPKKPLDLFICSKNVDVKSFRVLTESKASDHLPVMLEVQL